MAKAKQELRKLGGRPVGRIGLGGRNLKLMVPRCQECQDQPNQGEDWWKRCRHGIEEVQAMGLPAEAAPYFTRQEHTIRRPILEKGEDGRTMVTGYEEEVEYELIPNTGQVQTGNLRVSSGAAVAYKRGVHGYRDPEDFGIAPFCEYQGCWSQDNLKTYSNGTYCREIEAKMARIDTGHRPGGKAYELVDEEKQREQIESINV